MGKTNSALGKALVNHLGYTVRMMVGGKVDERTKKTVKVHNGKFGIYAGKKLIEEISKLDSYPTSIDVIIARRMSQKK